MRNVVLLVHFGTKKTARAAVSFLNLSFKDYAFTVAARSGRRETQWNVIK